MRDDFSREVHTVQSVQYLDQLGGQGHARDDSAEKYTQFSQFNSVSSVQSFDQLGRRGHMRDNAAEKYMQFSQFSSVQSFDQ